MLGASESSLLRLFLEQNLATLLLSCYKRFHNSHSEESSGKTFSSVEEKLLIPIPAEEACSAMKLEAVTFHSFQELPLIAVFANFIISLVNIHRLCLRYSSFRN